MTDLEAAAKWDRIHAAGDDTCGAPSRVLAEFAHLLPATGDALDPACGRGADALLLAQHGLRTRAWDISPVAIERLAGRAAAIGVRLHLELRDAVADPPDADSFDVIVVCHFLDRTLIPRLRSALRPGGLIYYQTFVKESVDGSGPRTPEYRLAENELLRLFAGLHIICYREEGRVGRLSEGLRNEAMLIGQRR